MCLFEEGTFLLNNRAKVIAFECISDCWWCDRRGEDIVNNLSGLDSIIKLSSSDLTNNGLLMETVSLFPTCQMVLTCTPSVLCSDFSIMRPW
jgi:hypothetical protein